MLSHKGPLEVHQLPVTEPELWLQVAKFRALIFPKLGAPEADSPQEASEESTDTSGFDARVKLGRWLYDQLLAKVDRRIADSQRLLILPDGPLYYLPFAAVMAPASDKPSGWQYLTEWKPVHTAQSATVYAELQQWRKKQEGTTPTLVALGDPSYPQSGPQPASQDSDKEAATHHLPFAVRSMVDRGLFDGLLPLPNTAREIDGIAGLFPKDHVRKYLGNQATEDRAKQELETASYVHLAAHGLADPFNSLNSFLALTIPEKWSADKNNGILQAWEVIDHLRLDADLVVLSACATALGPELGGEGLMSLARAFQIAGARTVAASLWPVADESTAELMIRFYRHLIQDHMPKDEALRTAQMELIRGPIEVKLEDGTVVERDFSAPYHWAAFQLIGDWQ